MQIPDGPATVKESRCQTTPQGGRGIQCDEPESGDLPGMVYAASCVRVGLGGEKVNPRRISGVDFLFNSEKL
ncbi:MAG: hypothetical protein Kow00111_09720 [Thermincola ferriacetica]